MKLPRLTISALMAVVVLVAFDIWACKMLVMTRRPPSDLGDLLVFGALPSTNILAVGLYVLVMPRYGHPTRRAGLIGFEIGGLTGLLVFLGFSLIMTHALHEGVGHLLRSIGLVPRPVFLVGAATALLSPQIALAILGARLGRTFRVRVRLMVERRAIPTAEADASAERLVEST